MVKEEKFIDRSNKSIATYLCSIKAYKTITPSEETQLVLRYQEGEAEARDLLVEANLRLVITIAREYQGRGMELEDLISEGNIGLIKAAEHFKPHTGAKFSSYAAYWIKESINEALFRYSTAIRIPHDAAMLYGRIEKVRERLQQELGRDPFIEEIAETMHIASSTLIDHCSALRYGTSLEKPLSDDDDYSYLDRLSTADATDRATAEETREEIEMLLRSQLNEREAFVIRHSFGFSGEPQTLAQIATHLSITPERVRQIKLVAEKKLKSSVLFHQFSMCG